MAGLEVLAELQQTADKVTYRAQRQGQEYTLTVLTQADPNGTGLRELYRRTSLLTGLHHPWLPRVHEVGVLLPTAAPTVDAGQPEPFLVTDLVVGRPLADLIAGNPLSGWHAVTLALDLARPLTAMHQLGLVHGDVNPRNITVLDDGSARLSDLGLISTSAGVLGYAAPEQSGAIPRPVDNRSDLYSLGVTLFESLTGTLPFTAPADLIAPDPRAHGAGAGISDTLAAVLATLLATDPDRRYQSGAALAIDLQRLLDDPLARFDPAPDRVAVGTVSSGPVLVGRDRELGLLTDLWDQVRHGDGQGGVLRGVGGVGSSRLAAEMLQIARQSGSLVLTIPCGLDSPVPLAPLRQGFEDLLAEAEALPTPRRADLYHRIRTAAGAAAPLLAGLCPALDRLLQAGRLPDGDRQDQFATAVARFITELARLSGGMMLIWQDAELLDPGTLRVMSHLATQLADVPLLSIGLIRRNGQVVPREHPLMPAINAAIDLDLELTPLAETAVSALVAGQLPGLDPASSTARLAHSHGHGNPFVLLELVRAVVDAGVLRPHWGSWRTNEPELARLNLTEDPLGLMLARVSGVELRSRRLFIVAAVIGPRFRPDVVAQVCGLGVDVVHTALADAAGRQLVELAGGGDYRFCHERIREAALDGVGGEELARLHQDVAEALDGLGPDTPDDLIYTIARHYLQGVPTRSADRAFEVCLTAGRQSLAAHAPSAATAFLEHAATLRPGDARMLFTLGTALHRSGEYGPARRHLEEALVVERDPVHRAGILVTLVEVHRATGNLQEANLAVERGLAELGAPPLGPGLWRMVSALGVGLAALLIMVTGWGLDSARGRQRERQRLLADLHRSGSYLATLTLRRRAVLIHRLRGAFAAARLGSGEQYSVSCAGIAMNAALLGRRRMARRYLARAIAAAAELADPQLDAQIAWIAGAAAYFGRVDNGERWIGCLSEHGDWLGTRQFNDAIAAICWEAAVQGRNDDVQRWYEQGRHRASFGGPTEVTELIQSNVVRLASAGQPEEAVAELGRARAIVDEYGGRVTQLHLVMAEMYALLERDEYGDDFELAAARFFSFGLSPIGMMRQHRTFLMLHARGRLAQFRAARSAEIYLLLTRKAVKQLRAVANTPLLLASYQQCRAELLVLEDRPERALALLAKVKPVHEDAPLLSFEIQRTRARALLAAGFPVEGRRQIQALLALAEEHRWPTRLRSLESEFGIRAAASRSGLEQAQRTGRAIRRRRDLAERLRRPAIPAQRQPPSQERLD